MPGCAEVATSAMGRMQPAVGPSRAPTMPDHVEGEGDAGERRRQNGYGGGARRTVTHCVSVNASTFAAAPPNRDPVPDAPTPPNGALASSFTVWSLMWTIPLGILSASARPCITSGVTMPRLRPYEVS